MDARCSVLDVRIFKNLGDPVYPLGHLFHKGVYALLEAFNLGGCAAANIRLHSTINILIRVELRTVGRQEKQLNAIFMSLDPLCYGLALVE